MDLIFMNENREDIGVLQDYSLDLAFGADENNFECQVQAANHCCKKNYMLYMEGTEYGGIVDGIGVDTENNAVTYSGRTWHGILGSKVIMPLMEGEAGDTPEDDPPEGALPKGYTELEYISSDGKQYIDTDFKPNQDTRVVVECEPTVTASSQMAVFGARNSNSGQASLAYGFNVMNSTSCRSDYLGRNATITGAYSEGTRISVDMNKNTCTVNGATGTVSANTGQSTYTLFLFNVNNIGTPHASFGFKGRIYACQIYDNDVLIRDFVPCKNDSDVIGMYDLVNGVFYSNDGSGTFGVGAEIEENNGADDAVDIDTAKVTIKGEDNDGSLVDKYLVISGEAHECIKFVLSRCGLSDLFSVLEDASGINITEYQFDRFTDAYKGLRKMLASANRLLHFSFDGNMVILSAIQKHDYSKDEEFDSDLLDFEMVRQENKVNHLICLGGGELENRLVRHLYVDADGKISETQTFFGLEEYAVIYDYANVESEEELLKAGREKLKELHDTDSLNVDFEAEDDLYNVGDIVGAIDNVTGIAIAAEIAKKIVTIKDGRTIISYEVGD